jgi:outer membrane receptor protein involved in Fe transport
MAEPAEDGLEEIIVTGERNRRSLFETPSSVAVVSGAELEDQPELSNVEEWLASVPNVQGGSGSQGPTIRGQDSTGVLQGVPAFLGGARPRVTLQVDGRAVGSNEFLFGAAPLWDVRRVELFRSPQTTTQGRNSIGGAIFVTTNHPTFNWESSARMLTGSFGTQDAAAVLSGPVVGDRIAFRLAGQLRVGRSSVDTADRLLDADPNRTHLGLLRLKLLAYPGAAKRVRLELTLVHQKTQLPQTETVRPPFRRRRDPVGAFGTFATRLNSATATASYTPDARFDAAATIAFGDAHIRRYAPPGLGETVTRSRDASAEAIARWHDQRGRHLLLGGSLVQTRLHQHIDLSRLIGIGDFDDVQASFVSSPKADSRSLTASR